ncbi:hypothetical protein [Paraburkholderia rhizosphaerae]|uniref:Uncharacterized protein n=1 Tax=Paraburkholderia rhizosphaerae TaxID=480658 RepID=A0A4R8L9P7_9BURK|nr:hypothetical protein [Paraburkholderia rhizosphaerae]TDY38799.1 hypothetical protein BX592_13025 [Paraburkholderia rhizosphaerae]
MDHTKLTARFPTVDVELTRRELPEKNGEVVTIHITATPSFDAAARWLLQPNVFAFATPLVLWAEMMRVWQPWLPAAFAPVLSLPRPE